MTDSGPPQRRSSAALLPRDREMREIREIREREIREVRAASALRAQQPPWRWVVTIPTATADGLGGCQFFVVTADSEKDALRAARFAALSDSAARRRRYAGISLREASAAIHSST